MPDKEKGSKHVNPKDAQQTGTQDSDKGSSKAGAAAATKPKKTKTIKVPIGFYGIDIAEVEREVPLDEPPTLPVNAELNVIGKSTKRLDGHLKVTGAARYTADIQLAGMLYGRLVRSTEAHARILSIDLSGAVQHPGVRAVHIISRNVGGARERDDKPRVDEAKASFDKSSVPIVKYVGQPVAAVAATSERAAREACELIKVEYEPLPFVIDIEDAMKPDAPKVFTGPTEQDGTAGGGGAPKGLPQKGNVRGPEVKGMFGGDRGNVESGFSQAEIVVENEYRTQIHMHSALEPHGIIADWRDDMLTIYASTQGTAALRGEIADVFNLPKSRIRVITEYMGGGFGAKFGTGNYGIAAIFLSKQAKAPVKLMHDRKEEQTIAGFRPNSFQKLKIGAKKDGTLTAIKLESYGSAGTSLGAGVGWAAQTLYKCENFASEHYDVLTNQSPGCAFRAPGQPQGIFAVEQAIDELCEKLKLDPVEMRDKIDANQTRKEQRKAGAKLFDWSSRKPAGADSGSIKRGVGMAQGEWPRFVDMNSSCEIKLVNDGSIEILSSVQDIGTGIRTVLAQVVAEELGLKPTDITVRIGDTVFPTGPASGGSVTTGSITPAVRKAAYHLKLKMFELAADQLKCDADDLTMKDGSIAQKTGSASITIKKLAKGLSTDQLSVFASRTADYGGFEIGDFVGHGRMSSVQFAEVRVDTDTGRIYIDRIVAAHACGRPMNPIAIESQINGGILQGISWALYEHRHTDKNTGVVMNPNVEQYKLIGAREIPKIDIVMLEEYLGRSATDAGGIGEPAIVPTAAAIANAVANAIGIRIKTLPMTPDKVLAALRKGSSN